MEKPERYAPVFEAAPRANTASVNAGDFRLYVGGGAINLAFARALGLSRPNGYAALHSELLGEALRVPGRLCSAHAAEQSRASATLQELGLAASFARAPVGSRRGPVGAAFLDVFAASSRPLHPRNVAMLYVVGPKGQGAPGGHGPTVAGRGEFLAAVEAMAHNAILAVAGYNASAGSRRDALPAVRALQFCLVSGGVYRHPGASKLDVAAATVRGLRHGASEGPAGEALPVVRFAYDEGVFERAVLADGSR